MDAQLTIKKLVAMVNKGHTITFERDLGDNTLTIYIDDKHTHIGIPEDNEHAFEVLVEGLYSAMINGPGLSWA